MNFRFYLTLAFAAATGERAAVAQIDALLDAHQNTRPLPPPPAQPDHARLTPLRPDRLAAAAAALLAFACATLTVATSKSEQDGLPYRAGKSGARRRHHRRAERHRHHHPEHPLQAGGTGQRYSRAADRPDGNSAYRRRAGS